MNLFIEILWFLILTLYYILEAIVTFFIPSRYRRKDVKGQIVLITGAGSGLGRLMAQQFARLGCKLVLWDVNSDSNEQTAAELRQLKVEVHTYTCDVANSDSVYHTASKVKTEVGCVDILINNAGIVTGRKILDCSDAMMKKTMDINVTAHFWTVKAFLPEMISRDHGHIVSISSAGGLFGVTGLCDYGASKAAVVGFHESLGSELYALNKTGVHMTLVCPFFINTGMFDGCKTRFRWLLPILDQDYVASKIVEAVLTNQAMLCLPRFIYVLVAFKAPDVDSIHRRNRRMQRRTSTLRWKRRKQYDGRLPRAALDGVQVLRCRRPTSDATNASSTVLTDTSDRRALTGLGSLQHTNTARTPAAVPRSRSLPDGLDGPTRSLERRRRRSKLGVALLPLVTRSDRFFRVHSYTESTYRLVKHSHVTSIHVVRTDDNQRKLI